MKQFLLFIAIFGSGALAFALLDMFLAKKAEAPVIVEENKTAVESPIAKQKETPIVEEEVQDKVVITPDGTLLDGPFVFFRADGTKTDATVRLVLSPEERLLQFENFDEEYSFASHVYFATDKSGSDYFNLGPAKMHEDYLVYGIPLDANLEEYSYILIYQTQLDETEYYAKIK